MWLYAGGAGGDDAADGCTVHARQVDGTGRGKGDLVKGKKAVDGDVAATLGPSTGFAAGLTDCGGPRVALPSASATRSRLFPEVFVDCSYVGRRPTPRHRAITRAMKESAFALNFLETGGIGLSESCEKVACSILSTDLASPALPRLHSVISDFRPPSITESGGAALRRLLASRAVGCYALTSDDPAPQSLTVFQSSRVARSQDPSTASKLVSLLSSSARSYLSTYKQRTLGTVSVVADMEAWLGAASRYVDPVFQHCRRHYVGFSQVC